MVDHHDIYALDAAALHRLREHEAILKPFSDQGHARRRHLYDFPVSW
jgi:hypothetical protein